MFYVVAEGEDIDNWRDCHRSFDRAKAMADDLKKHQGVNFFIVKVETVWSTSTLDELDNG
mgnify:CR=1 FL=1